MRQVQIVLLWAGTVLLGLAGCKTQPELKPPPQPEVLASPGENDKRYILPCSYPAEVLAGGDDSKKQDALIQAGGKRNAGMSMSQSGQGGGMPPPNQ